MNAESRCGYIAIVGRPNVGKSTLLNTLIGKKISITTPKPQTTRHQILGIKTIDDAQLIFVDTPGLHHAQGRAMNRYLNRLATSVIPDADIVLMMIDAKHFTEEDEKILEKMADVKSPIILLINKIDVIKDKNKLLPLIDSLHKKFNFTDIIPISAKKSDNLTELQKAIIPYLPAGPHLFPDEMITDKNESFQIAELIREQLILALEQEVPYSVTVEIESFKKTSKLLDIAAMIWVEREGQKAIVIGKNGEGLKKIGTKARKELEKRLGQKVFLRLWVKVKSDWTDDEKALRGLGYE